MQSKRLKRSKIVTINYGILRDCCFFCSFSFTLESKRIAVRSSKLMVHARKYISRFAKSYIHGLYYLSRFLLHSTFSQILCDCNLARARLHGPHLLSILLSSFFIRFFHQRICMRCQDNKRSCYTIKLRILNIPLETLARASRRQNPMEQAPNALNVTRHVLRHFR